MRGKSAFIMIICHRCIHAYINMLPAKMHCAYCHSYHILGKQYSISTNSFSYILLTPLPCMIPSPQTMHVSCKMLNKSNNRNVSFILFYNQKMCPKIPCMHCFAHNSIAIHWNTCLDQKHPSLQRYSIFIKHRLQFTTHPFESFLLLYEHVECRQKSPFNLLGRWGDLWLNTFHCF